MNLRELEYITSIAKHKHFGKASEECFVSQPALSKQVAKLEEELDLKIFERTNKNVLITEAGQEIIKRASEILHNTRELKNFATHQKNPLGGSIKIGSFPTLAPYYFPKIMPILQAEFPSLKVFLVEEKTETLIKMLKSGELDFAFLAVPVEADFLQERVIFAEEFLLAVSKNSPLAKQKYAEISNIHNKELLLLEEGHCYREQALSICQIAGAREHSFNATSLTTLLQMVRANMGITVIPQIAATPQDGIKFLPFKKGSPKRQIALFTRKTTVRKKLFEEMAKLLKAL